MNILKTINDTYTNTVKILELLSSDPRSDPKGLADYAEAFLGTDASPNDVAPDELGCAESVSEIIQEIFPDFKMQPATWILKDQLDADSRFERVVKAKRGDIIMSPTRSGDPDVGFIGHTGIFQSPTQIMSNSSYSSPPGMWEKNFTLDSWVKRYRGLGNLKIYYYRIKQ